MVPSGGDLRDISIGIGIGEGAVGENALCPPFSQRGGNVPLDGTFTSMHKLIQTHIAFLSH